LSASPINTVMLRYLRKCKKWLPRRFYKNIYETANIKKFKHFHTVMLKQKSQWLAHITASVQSMQTEAYTTIFHQLIHNALLEW